MRYNAYQGDAWAQGYRSARRGFGRWTGFELIVMVVGFVIFWPIGLAILGYKLWQRNAGGPDLQAVLSEGWTKARDVFAGGGPAPAYSGNSAFDDWRAAEIARLEEERRKLDEAKREFEDFLANIRKAKDREEFERFMNERRNRPQA